MEDPRRYIELFNELLDLPAEDINSLTRTRPRRAGHNGAAQVTPDVVN
jgi:hypothetical protein